MDKRRNTLDRWQRLGFGRRSNASSEKPEKEKSKGSEKTERLRELTELLRGSRPSVSTSVSSSATPPIPPPIPPPRKQKSIGSQTQDNSSTNSSIRDLSDIPTPDNAVASKAIACPTVEKPLLPNKPVTIIKSLRPNASAGQLECYGHFPSDKLSKSPPLAEKEDDLFTALPKAESRTIVGSYTQKNIPFRSASFSQVDYSSGKYIRSAIGAFKASLKSHKEPSVIDNTNLTLPRKNRQSPTKNEDENQNNIASSSCGPNRIYKTEMSVTFQPSRNQSINQSIDGRMESKFHRESLIEENENENENDESLEGLTIVKASEMVIESPSERGILMATPPQDAFLQTATTCLIPLPVYECANRESETSEQWINACDDDSTKLFEEVNVESDVINEIGWEVLKKSGEVPESIAAVDEVDEAVKTANEIVNLDDENTETDILPLGLIQSEEIEVISTEMKVVDELPPDRLSPCRLSDPTEAVIIETTDDQPIIPVTIEHASDPIENPEPKSEFVEVRKRHNNDEKSTRQSDNLSNSSESVNSVATGEDRRRSDKSKRRKGIYFQWPVVEKDKELDVDVWSHADSSSPILSSSILWDGSIDIQSVGSPSKSDSKEMTDCQDHGVKANEKPKKISVDLNPPNFFSPVLESTTPDSEIGRPVWPKMLPKQHSDDRDDVSVVSAISDKQYHKISFIRQDSTSDNEDRTPPNSERVSQSQTSDQDLKRYSKRPLRGPYGQMLEAEMKKPGKLLYDEVFSRSERYDIIACADQKDLNKLPETEISNLVVR